MKWHLSTLVKFLLAVVMVSPILAMTACSSGGGARQGGDGSFDAVAQTSPAAAVASSLSNSADYRIGSQDQLEISVFQVTDLSRTVRVNTRGDISLPLVGVLHVGGLTAQQVEALIAEQLTKSYLQNPQVSVFVKEFSSQRVTLEGEITKPGVYPLTGETSLLQMVAIGGGLKEIADAENVLVFRVIEGQKKAARFDLKQIRQGNAEDPKIYGDDIVVFPESGTKNMFGRIIKSMPILGLFTFF